MTDQLKQNNTKMTHIDPNGRAVGGSQPEEILALHIYSQPWEHCEARIVGNRMALQALTNAIGEALTTGKAETKEEIYATDGEGYTIEVIVMPDDWKDPKWEEYPPHYCDRGYSDDLHKE